MNAKNYWLGALAMCTTIAHGQCTNYYEAVVSGCSLLCIDESFPGTYVDADSIRRITRESERLINVSVVAVKEDASAKLKEYELSIAGNSLFVVLSDGIIRSLSRDGVRIEMPRMDLRGNPDWRKLSGKFHAQTLRRISFTNFLGLDENANATQFFVIGRNVASQTFEYVCGKSRLFRQVEYCTNGDIMRIYECVGGNGVDALRFGNDTGRRSAGWNLSFSATFHVGTGMLKSFICKEYSVKFSHHGGIESLVEFDSVSRKAVRERKWDERGALTCDRDLIVNPYPPFNPENAVIRK
jgi:hypothetical protein